MSSATAYTGTATLVALSEDVHPSEYLLSEQPCKIGRVADECHIIVVRRSVSRIHAMIWRQSMRFFLRDLGSSNGTFVNSQPIPAETDYLLKHHDTIGLANEQPLLRFNDNDATTIEPRRLQYLSREQRFIYKGVALDLSPNLTRLLLPLHTHAGEVCSREKLVQAIWPDTAYDPQRIPQLHTEIKELREKFEAIDPTTEIIKNRRGVGYYLDVSQ